TALPTSSSPTTATTAGSCDRTAAIRSDRLNAGASLLAAGLSHNRTAASRSSAWKSRTRQGAIALVCHQQARRAAGGPAREPARLSFSRGRDAATGGRRDSVHALGTADLDGEVIAVVVA